MNKLVLIALLGAASAKKTYKVKPVSEEMGDLYSRPKRCTNIDPKNELDDMTMLRLMGQSGSKAFFSGLYQADANVVSDECFGSWMEGTWGEISTFNDKFFEDPFGPSVTEYSTYATNWMSLLVKNADKCQWKMITDDLQNWCLDNKDVCLLGKGLEMRIYNNATGILTALVDIFKMMEVDDTCYTTQQQVDEWSRLLKNYGQLSAQVSGFDSKWDKSVQPKHIKMATFSERIDEFWASTVDMTEDELTDLQFPELSKILSDFGDMLEDIFGKIDAGLDFMFKPIEEMFDNFSNALFAPMKPTRHTSFNKHIQMPTETIKVNPMNPWGEFDLGKTRKEEPHKEEKKHEEHKPKSRHQHHEHQPQDFWGRNSFDMMPKWNNWEMPRAWN